MTDFIDIEWQGQLDDRLSQLGSVLAEQRAVGDQQTVVLERIAAAIEALTYYVSGGEYQGPLASEGEQR